MKYSTSSLSAAATLLYASMVSAQTLYLAGDSTMAAGNGVIQGQFCFKAISLLYTLE